MQPMNNQLVVKPVVKEVEEKTAAGLYVPQQVIEKQIKEDRPTEGEVLFVHEDSKLKVGDKVVFSRNTGSRMVIDGLDCLIIDEKFILLRK